MDPHGDSAKKLLRMSMDLPPRIRAKILYVRVADPQWTAAINPLRVNPDGLTDYEYECRLRVAVEQTAHLIFSVMGETKFGGPVLRKWLTRWLYFLAKGKLTLADADLLIDPSNQVYQLLMKLVDDDLVRYQM